MSCSIYNDGFSTHDCYSTKTQMCKTQYPGCHDLVKWLSYYLYFFSFSFLFFSRLTTQGWSMRKYHVTKHHRVTGSQSGNIT